MDKVSAQIGDRQRFCENVNTENEHHKIAVFTIMNRTPKSVFPVFVKRFVI